MAKKETPVTGATAGLDRAWGNGLGASKWRDAKKATDELYARQAAKKNKK